MADELNVGRQTRLHQALHGYAEGHCELALSTELRPGDRKRLLALSDVSGSGARLGEEGYLTGYPLGESGYFALGRTWPAPEMARPGCVWTHTLLVEFTDLAALATLVGLLSMFRRPDGGGSASGYRQPVMLLANAGTQLSVEAKAWAREVMAGLYGEPRRRVIARRFGAEVDRTVVALWSQQWPRLRRSFRFCTLAARDRSSDGGSFDLQVLPGVERAVSTRFGDVVDAASVDPRGRWRDDAIGDLAEPGGSELRELFRRLGGEVAAGRGAFRPFCLLHDALAAARRRPETICEALAVVEEESGVRDSRSARAAVAAAALDHVEVLDDRAFEFLWNNVDVIDPEEVLDRAVRLGRSAWRREPSLLASIVSDKGVRGVVLERTLADLDVGELMSGVAARPELREAALVRRPELVGEAAFGGSWSMWMGHFERRKPGIGMRLSRR